MSGHGQHLCDQASSYHGKSPPLCSGDQASLSKERFRVGGVGPLQSKPPARDMYQATRVAPRLATHDSEHDGSPTIIQRIPISLQSS